MPTITVPPDCGNAPKKEFLRDFEIAFAESNAAFILDAFAEDIRWDMVGDQVIEGKEAAQEKLYEMLDGSITELSLDVIITHGGEGAVQGTMKFKDGTVFRFCDIYKFTGHGKDTKIKSLTSFVAQVETL